MKPTKLILILALVFMYFSGNSQSTNFTIKSIEGSAYLYSCIDAEIYTPNLLTQKIEHREIRSSKTINDLNKSFVMGSFWDEDCLVVDVRKKSDKEIISLIEEFTILKKKEIIITRK